jgi:TonB family protein
MRPKSEKVPEEIPIEVFGSLRGCLVQGDVEQRLRERRVRCRALAISIVLQCAALTLLVLVPLFGKADRIALGRVYVPIPPYGHPGSHPRGNAKPSTSKPTGSELRFTFQPSTTRPIRKVGGEMNPIGPQDFDPPGNQSKDGAGCSWCVDIGGKNSGPRPPQPPNESDSGPRVIRMTNLDPAMLIRRVEPVYPPLAIQIRREGRVELRAIIATDGTIQSLQVVGGDPMFYQSALDAVRQWRYRATVLNGQTVAIDTRITVLYSLQH